MKLIISLNSKQRLYDYVSMGIDTFILGCKYSFYAPCYYSLEDIKTICQEYPQCHFYVALNALYDEHDIETLKNYIDELSKLSIYGIIFEDFGILFFALLTIAALVVIIYMFVRSSDVRAQL